jgi:hypothetical protein
MAGSALASCGEERPLSKSSPTIAKELTENKDGPPLRGNACESYAINERRTLYHDLRKEGLRTSIRPSRMRVSKQG